MMHSPAFVTDKRAKWSYTNLVHDLLRGAAPLCDVCRLSMNEALCCGLLSRCYLGAGAQIVFSPHGSAK